MKLADNTIIFFSSDNIPQDIGESKDLGAQNPEVVKALTAKALEWAGSLPSSPVRETAAKTGRVLDGKSAPKAGKGKPR